MAEITPAEQIRLNLLSTLNYDTAAAAKAIEFVQDTAFWLGELPGMAGGPVVTGYCAKQRVAEA
ncbi:hypothetical protein ABN151_12660 [Klebsiella oxytoca]|uniref:hypothetical protein n=1 Tax=Klebsiella oxytoca TaxID=571 RepID=UPI0032DACDA5